MNGGCRLIALHGFLGRASDWDVLRGWLPRASVEAIDLWPLLSARGVTGWPSMARALDEALARAAGDAASVPVFVVGYSFGARLLLSSAWVTAPGSPVRGCCLVSCNPGLSEGDAAARTARQAADEAWARRILEWPEDELWRAWDAQPVFAGSVRLERAAGLPAPRETLAAALGTFSLAGQPDGRPRLRAWPSPLLWVTGARDGKFSALARELAEAGVPARFVACDEAGHRVPWDTPGAFAGALGAWMTRVMETGR